MDDLYLTKKKLAVVSPREREGEESQIDEQSYLLHVNLHWESGLALWVRLISKYYSLIKIILPIVCRWLIQISTWNNIWSICKPTSTFRPRIGLINRSDQVRCWPWIDVIIRVKYIIGQAKRMIKSYKFSMWTNTLDGFYSSKYGIKYI